MLKITTKISPEQFSFLPVNGVWGSWSGWSTCSATCGTGLRNRKRYCDNPTPEDGGNYCTGTNNEYETCSKVSCSGSI